MSLTRLPILPTFATIIARAERTPAFQAYAKTLAAQAQAGRTLTTAETIVARKAA